MIYLCAVIDWVVMLEDKTKNCSHVRLVLLRVHLHYGQRLISTSNWFCTSINNLILATKHWKTICKIVSQARLGPYKLLAILPSDGQWALTKETKAEKAASRLKNEFTLIIGNIGKKRLCHQKSIKSVFFAFLPAVAMKLTEWQMKGVNTWFDDVHHHQMIKLQLLIRTRMSWLWHVAWVLNFDVWWT